MSDKIREYGSEFDSASNAPFIKDKITLTDENTYYYRSGRDSLKAVALYCKESCDKILLPALCCESMVIPFVANGYKAEFYRLNKDYSADVESITEKADGRTILLYMNYFGNISLCDNEFSALKSSLPTMVFIEDRTHDIIFNSTSRNFVPDFTSSSLRKWFSLPDGGMLQTKYRMESPESEYDFYRLRLEAMDGKSRYLALGDKTAKDLFRRKLGEASELLDEKTTPFGMTKESKELLSRIDFPLIATYRRKNAALLEEKLSAECRNGRIKLVSHNIKDGALYFPILVGKRDAVQTELAKKGIYCPVIWPLYEKAKNVCSVSDYTASEMLALPCDQRYGEKDMEFIADALIKILAELCI